MIHFMRYRWLYLILSSLVIVPGLFSLFRFGLKPAIDFTGGTLLELRITNSKLRINTDDLKDIVVSHKLEVASIQPSGSDSYILRLKPIDNEQKQKLVAAVKEKYKDVNEVRFETVGPTLGKELLEKTFVAALMAIVAILLYVAWAFKNIRFGVSAIIALVHDLLVVAGVFSLLGVFKGVEVDSLFVTAVLTTMSFSVHDTIVVFDRIRESLKKEGDRNFGELIDRSLTETIGRSLNNSLTIIFMLLGLFLLGGETIRWFVLAMLVGTTSGAYSSPFVAAPILYTWHRLRNKQGITK